MARRSARVVGRAAEQRREERPRLAQPVGQVVQVAQQPVGGQPGGPGDGAAARRAARARLERGPCLGLGRRPVARLGERARDRHRPAEEAGQAIRRSAQARRDRRGPAASDDPQLEAVGVAAQGQPARPGRAGAARAAGLLARSSDVVRDRRRAPGRRRGRPTAGRRAGSESPRRASSRARRTGSSRASSRASSAAIRSAATRSSSLAGRSPSERRAGRRRRSRPAPPGIGDAGSAQRRAAAGRR